MADDFSSGNNNLGIAFAMVGQTEVGHKRGLWEISHDLPEADFWPGYFRLARVLKVIIRGVAVCQPCGRKRFIDVVLFIRGAQSAYTGDLDAFEERMIILLTARN
jgi:hypothetical protein